MRKILLLAILTFVHISLSLTQETKSWQGRFEQLDKELPTPNQYRTGSGAPGEAYWQQRADYVIDVELDDDNQMIIGKESITYYNNSPHSLSYLWLQLDQNVREQGSNSQKVRQSTIRDSLAAKQVAGQFGVTDYDGGFKLQKVQDGNGNDLEYIVNKTMMRIDLPQDLKPGENTVLKVDWYYNINDRMKIRGRGGYEYFPDEDNYIYTIAQWYPRMAVYDDFEGWQNKQFLGSGEFTLSFGNFTVNITVPEDHIVAATGALKNAKDVLSKEQFERFNQAKTSFSKPVLIVTEEEAIKNEGEHASKTETWRFQAENVRDFAFASSRKFIWDAQAVKIGDNTPLAMSFYPKEGNPLWEQESTKAVKNTLETYSKYTIPYPYPVAISVHSASIGMEYPMICFNLGRPKPDGSYSEGTKNSMITVIVHEVGHNFFPMIVNSDERQWTWMDEGLNTFLQYRTEQECYEDFPSHSGPPAYITRYMRGNQEYIRPIMTNSEQIMQFGNNAYAKPATALNILRETIMGPELFDKAFKTYAERWAFKHPKPADFFRTMEDASAIDLDWFWRGWFYTVDYVDIAVDEVKWFTLRSESVEVNPSLNSMSMDTTADGDTLNFNKGPEYFSVIETNPGYYGEFKNQIDDDEVIQELSDKNFYQIKFKNKGGLVMPLIVKFTFDDGSTTTEYIPAEIWRYNEYEVNKVFYFDKEVVKIELDPNKETADVEMEDNVFPR